MYDVVTIGDAMKDIYVFPSLDEMKKQEKFLVLDYGDKITITESFEDIGGTACNVAVGLKKTNLKTAIITGCGRDNKGEDILKKLKDAKVDTSMVDIKNKKSSFSVIISYKGDRSILVYHGYEPKDFVIPKNLETDWLYVGPMAEDYQSLFSNITGLASEKDVQIVLNPGSVQIHDGIHAFQGLLSVTKIIFVNREEGQQLAGLANVANIKDIARNIHKAGPEIVVITDGQEGAYVYFQGEFLKVGAYPGHRVESTGAGDAFASGFLAAFIKKEKLLDCLKWGVINGASVVGKYGAQQGLLSATTLKKRATEYKWPADSLRFS